MVINRKESLLNLFKEIDSKELITQSIDELLFLEEQLQELRQVPHLKYHPTNKNISKRTEAGKLYKDYLQQYNNLVKSLISVLQKNDTENDDSPLRIYFKQVQGKTK